MKVFAVGAGLKPLMRRVEAICRLHIYNLEQIAFDLRKPSDIAFWHLGTDCSGQHSVQRTRKAGKCNLETDTLFRLLAWGPVYRSLIGPENPEIQDGHFERLSYIIVAQICRHPHCLER